MVQSIGNSIKWLILTRLDDRCILQLYLKIMPGIVECLQAQHAWLKKLLQQTCYCRTSVPTASAHTNNISQTSCAYIKIVLQGGSCCRLHSTGHLHCTKGNQEGKLKVEFI